MIYYVIMTENIDSKILFCLDNIMCVTSNQHFQQGKSKSYSDAKMQLTNEIACLHSQLH